MFADPTGRRARVWAVLGGLVGAVAFLYLVALVFSLLGIPGVPQVGLPGVGPGLDRPEPPVRVQRTSPSALDAGVGAPGDAPTTTAAIVVATPAGLPPAPPQEVPLGSPPTSSSPSNQATGTVPRPASPPAAATDPAALPPVPPVSTTAAAIRPSPGSSSATPAASRPSPPSTSGSASGHAPASPSAPPAADAPSWGAGGTPDHGPPVSAPGRP